MPEAIGPIQPFVWLYLRTEEDDFAEPRLLSLTGNFLRSFQDENAFNLSGPGGTTDRVAARSKARLVMFDPSGSYLETLFLYNRTVDYEFGWMRDDGSVLTTSGRQRALVGSVQPKFSYQGTELEVILYADLSATSSPGSSSYTYSTSIISHTFIPEKVFLQIRDGTYYNDRYPNLRAPSAVERREEANERIRRRNRNSISTVGGSITESITFREQTDEELFGPKYELPLDAAPYRSIGDLVTKLAFLIGMKAEVDETIDAFGDITVPDMTIYEFIKTKLVPIAVSKDGTSGYRFWIRGDTLHFKYPRIDKVVREFTYGADNTELSKTFEDDTDTRKGTMLSFELLVRPNQIQAGAKVSTVAVSYDPVGKAFRGINLTEADKRKQDALAANTAIELGLKQETPVDFSKAKEEDAIKALNAASFEWGGPLARPKPKPVPRNENGVPFFPVASQQEEAIQALREDEARTQAAANQAEVELAITAQQVNPTAAGRLYVLPYPDNRTSAIGKFIFADAVNGPVFTAKSVILGDPQILLQDTIDVTIVTPTGPHYGSGKYTILGVNSVIDDKGSFTTELSLSTNSVNLINNRSLAAVSKEASNPVDTAKPAPSEAAPGFNISSEPLTIAEIIDRMSRGQ